MGREKDKDEDDKAIVTRDKSDVAKSPKQQAPAKQRRTDVGPAAPSETVELARMRHRTTLTIVDRTYKLLRSAIGSATVIIPSYFLYLSVDAIAGKDTKFSAVVRAMIDVGVNEWAAWGLASIFGVSWYTERRLRRKTIADQGKHIRELESRQAPEREQNGSGLLPDGQQKAEDKDV